MSTPLKGSSLIAIFFPWISNTICTLTAQCTYLAQALTLSLALPGQPHCLSSIEWSSLLISQLCLRPSGGENF